MRHTVIKPVAQETIADRFAIRLQNVERRLADMHGELLAIQRDATAAGWTIEPTMLLLGRLKRATEIIGRVLANDGVQFELDLPPDPTGPAGHDGP